MMEKLYADFAWEQAAALLSIDSPKKCLFRFGF